MQVHYLGAIGDTVVAETTRCVLRSMTTNAVAECMYFARYGSKIGISELKIMNENWYTNHFAFSV